MSFVVAHPGFGSSLPYFAGTQFYATYLERRGTDIIILLAEEPMPPGYDKVVVCGPTRDRYASKGRLAAALITTEHVWPVRLLKVGPTAPRAGDLWPYRVAPFGAHASGKAEGKGRR